MKIKILQRRDKARTGLLLCVPHEIMGSKCLTIFKTVSCTQYTDEFVKLTFSFSAKVGKIKMCYSGILCTK